MFRRHVACGADKRPCRRLRDCHAFRRDGTVDLRHAEVENFYSSVRREHHVVRLDVAMRHAGRVRGRERLGDLRSDLCDLSNGKLRTAQRDAVDELRDDIGEVSVCPDVEDRHDVRMIQRGNVSRFLLETGEARRIRGEIWRQDLERDVASEPRVTRPIQFAHSAAPERGDELIDADPGSCDQQGVQEGL